MFHKLYLFLSESPVRLEEALTASEIKKMRAEISTPEILPCTFDVTILGWLSRIKIWGKLVIHHKDPENFRGSKKVTEAQFLDRISDPELTKMFGKWHIEKKGLTEVEFLRDYCDKDGKMRTESFHIEVELRKELQ